LGDKVHNIELCFNVIYNGHGFLFVSILVIILTDKTRHFQATTSKNKTLP
jgi:hypothetical protein